MAALSITLLDDDAAVLCASEVDALSASLAREPVWMASRTAYAVFVTRVLNAPSVGRLRSGVYQTNAARARTIVVSEECASEAQRALLRSGFGDVMRHHAETIATLRARLLRWAHIDTAVAQPLIANSLIGTSEAWLATLRSVAESALFSAAPVLITGPTGTGKELLARMLHTLDPRPKRRELMTVDCTTLARDLAGSELFGHERGAFTGATSEREGAIACADGGTLFLDEIGELPLELQAQLLRVLQEKVYRRVGSTTWRRSEFRVVCATNRDLPTEVAAGRFRADLYHRIAAMTCRTPSLDERREDIPQLAHHFASDVHLSPALLDYLASRAFKGNVRELHQLVQACLRKYAGVGPMCLGCLPDEESRQWDPEDPLLTSSEWHDSYIDAFARNALQANLGLKDLGRRVQAAAVRVALAECNSITAAAQRLGVTPRALHLRRAAESE